MAEVHYTYNRNRPQEGAFPGAKNVYAHRVDLVTGEGLAAAAAGNDVIVNAAAISQPAACERDGDARAVNVPDRLLAAMDEEASCAPGGPPLLLHISTDHVYDGQRAAGDPLYSEDDETRPVNAYGETKLAAERAVRSWGARTGGAYVILRPSIIFGGEAPAPIARGLFLQWAEGVLDRQMAAGPPAADGGGGADSRIAFYDDEYRSPTYVADLCKVIAKMVLLAQGEGSTESFAGQTFNCGGDRSMSRAEMVLALARLKGYDAGAVRTEHAPARRPIPLPLSIGMDSGKLKRALRVTMTEYDAALREIFSDR